MSSWPTRQSRVNKAFCTSQHSGQQEAGSACLADLFPCLMLAFSSPFLPRLPPSDRCSYGGQVLLLVPWRISHQLCRGRGIKPLSKAWGTTLYMLSTNLKASLSSRFMVSMSGSSTRKVAHSCRSAHTVTTQLRSDQNQQGHYLLQACPHRHDLALVRSIEAKRHGFKHQLTLSQISSIQLNYASSSWKSLAILCLINI